MSDYDYDFLVMGCGPAGQKAALSAALYHRKVAMVEPKFIGGICTHRGTVPSKTFREAALHLTNFRLRFMEPQTREKPTMKALVRRVDWVIQNDMSVIERQLKTANVDIIPGYGEFVDEHTMSVFDTESRTTRTVTFDKAIVGTGTRPYLREDVEFDGEHIFYTDNILQMKELPKSITIVGGGIIGCEYASIFSILGVEVTVVEQRTDILSLIDREIRAQLVHTLDQRKVRFCLGEEVTSCAVLPAEDGEHVETRLSSGKVIRSSTALFCTFRMVCTKDIGLERVGVSLGARGNLSVNADFQTSVPNIYAAGDVVGHPALASTSFEQGRVAAHRAMGIPCYPMSPSLPIGIYTIPEISYIGPTEEELTKAQIPYQVGKSWFSETARGKIIGALDGMLKIIFHQDTLQVLAVHVIGEGATELIHVGQAVIEHGGTVDYFVERVFNYPTLAEAYKYAAADGLNRMYDR